MQTVRRRACAVLLLPHVPASRILPARKRGSPAMASSGTAFTPSPGENGDAHAVAASFAAGRRKTAAAFAPACAGYQVGQQRGPDPKNRWLTH